MAKFSIFGDEEEEDAIDEQDLCPKRRRTSNTFQSNSSSTSPFVSHHQQSHQSDNYTQNFDDDDDDDSVGPTPTKSGGPISVVLSDPDVLDCPICFNPLTIPIFQCDNGHIACSPCSNNLGNKCPSCCGKIGNNRCRAIEKVIESIQVPCSYSKYGCKENINYSKKHEHEEKCKYAPCLCPFLSCLFQGSPKSLSYHVNKEHANHVIHFWFDSVFSVSLGFDQNIVVLREETNGILFILTHGNTIAIRCIDSSAFNGKFGYDIVLRKGRTSLKFQSFTHCTTGRFNDHLSKDYVTIPGFFYTNDCLLELEICIRSKDDTC